ncbi:MAG TPA: YrhB domain-containing protein [Anaerolineales bacterium]|nr:YrhB domain-containing protein [Anaerolineales bacterium]
MITYEQACRFALDYIKPSAEYIKKTLPDDELVIEHSVEFHDCWLFHFNSKRYLETHNIFHRLVGGGPVIVGKEKGDVYQGGSVGTVETWLNEFREFVQDKNSQGRQSGDSQ